MFVKKCEFRDVGNILKIFNELKKIIKQFKIKLKLLNQIVQGLNK